MLPFYCPSSIPLEGQSHRHGLGPSLPLPAPANNWCAILTQFFRGLSDFQLRIGRGFQASASVDRFALDKFFATDGSVFCDVVALVDAGRKRAKQMTPHHALNLDDSGRISPCRSRPWQENNDPLFSEQSGLE